MKIGIIIPAYNEEERIGSTLKDYSKVLELKTKKGDKYTILVVVNNTNDDTVGVIKKIKKTNSNIAYLDLKEGGKGYAIKEGLKFFSKERYDLIGFTDADSSTPAESFYSLIENIGKYDGVIASRYIKGARVEPKQDLKRRLVSRMGNLVIRSLFMFNYKDTQCGAKVFRRQALEKIIDKLSTTQWGFDIDLLYLLCREGYKVKEFPIYWRDAPGSKLNIKRASIQVFLATINIRLTNSPFKKVLKVTGPIAGFIWKGAKKI